MKLNTKNIRLIQSSGEWFTVINIPNNLVDKLKPVIDKDVAKSIEIKVKRQSRSLNANNFSWQLINKLAIKMGSTDDEVYNNMLHRYGVKEYYVAPEGAMSLLKKAYKIVEMVSGVQVNKKDAIQFRCIRGQSTYDTKEMSTFIEGIISEAKLLKIETLTTNEIKIMMANYKEN